MGRLKPFYTEIIARYKAGESASAIGKDFDIKYREVWRVLQKNGVSVRHSQKYFRNAEDEIQVIREYAGGKSLSDLASEYGCNLVTIRNVLLKHNVQPRRRGGRRTSLDVQIEQGIVSSYQGGETIERIARRLGFSHGLVSRILAENGVSTKRYGERHPRWKGGRVPVKGGSALIKLPAISPFASMRDGKGYVKEHRLLMAQHLGRPLLPTETVHHINGDSSDNRIENLELRQGRHGRGAAFVCADCGSHNVVPAELES